MRPKAISLLRELCEKAMFIPITSRSIAQYRRIVWPAGIEPKFVICANGGVLLCNGKPDTSWGHFCNNKAMLGSYYEKLKSDDRLEHCRIVDESYLYLRRKVGAEVEDILALFYGTECSVISASDKFYILPPGIDKASSMERIRRYTDAKLVIAAGDSAADFGMLAEADYAFSLEENKESIIGCAELKLCPSGREFSEFLLEESLNICSRQGGSK